MYLLILWLHSYILSPRSKDVQFEAEKKNFSHSFFEKENLQMRICLLKNKIKIFANVISLVTIQYRISTTIGILWSDFDFLMDISVSGQWSHILCKYEDLLICLAIKHALKPFCAKLHRPWKMICWLSGLTQRKGNANFLAHTHSLLKNIQSKWFHNKKLFCTLSLFSLWAHMTIF